VQVNRAPSMSAGGAMFKALCARMINDLVAVVRRCPPLRPPRAPKTKMVQGWRKLWVNFRYLIGIFSQNAGSTCEFWVNPVDFTLDNWAERSPTAAGGLERRELGARAPRATATDVGRPPRDSDPRGLFLGPKNYFRL
jgi:hypothetical protein